ncbi:hypothetical protein APT07_24175 [Escherichia coli]|nr:hypothetical protein APT07_24175 [Escherichia coli]
MAGTSIKAIFFYRLTVWSPPPTLPSAHTMFDYPYIGNDSNLLIVFYVQIMPDDFVMQLHRF